MSTPSDPWAKLAKYLPTGALLAFSSIVPLTTSDGKCGPAEWAVTGSFLLLMTVSCFLMAFTETLVMGKKHYYGLVTPRGLWSPTLEEDHPNDRKVLADPKYCANWQDFAHACISTAVFVTLAVLTDPVAVCFFGSMGIPPVVKKSVPPIVAGAASVLFSFFGPPRAAVGYPVNCKNWEAKELGCCKQCKCGCIQDAVKAAGAGQGDVELGEVNDTPTTNGTEQ